MRAFSGAWWLGAAPAGALLSVFLLTVDPGRMVSAVWTADYHYLLPGVLSYFASLYLRAVRWRLMVTHLVDVPSTRLYPVVALH